MPEASSPGPPARIRSSQILSFEVVRVAAASVPSGTRRLAMTRPTADHAVSGTVEGRAFKELVTLLNKGHLTAA
jgi:hypothetical protein